MKPPENNEALDALLHDENKYMEDDGFTGRVLARLPQRRRRAWLRPVLLLAAAVIGSALAIRWLPWTSLVPLDVSVLVSLNLQVLAPWALVFSVVASVVWAVIAAIQWED